VPVAVRNFLVMMEGDEAAYEVVYCAAFVYLDATWLDMKASYMEFNKVLAAVKAKVLELLSLPPASLAEVVGALGLDSSGMREGEW
jgi:hypothetical protein